MFSWIIYMDYSKKKKLCNLIGKIACGIINTNKTITRDWCISFFRCSNSKKDGKGFMCCFSK